MAEVLLPSESLKIKSSHSVLVKSAETVSWSEKRYANPIPYDMGISNSSFSVDEVDVVESDPGSAGNRMDDLKVDLCLRSAVNGVLTTAPTVNLGVMFHNMPTLALALKFLNEKRSRLFASKLDRKSVV